MSAFFITGTDTEIGKTYSVCQIIAHAKAQHCPVWAYKPIAAGVDDSGNNEDVVAIAKALAVATDHPLLNSVLLNAPVAPHIAANREQQQLDVTTLLNAYHQVYQQHRHGLLLVEGAGGWQLPLNDEQYLPDFVKAARLPVIMVVGMKLGCLNHALLTVQAIEQQGLVLAGWIANFVAPNMHEAQANLASLQQRIAAPLLAITEFGEAMTLTEAGRTVLALR